MSETFWIVVLRAGQGLLNNAPSLLAGLLIAGALRAFCPPPTLQRWFAPSLPGIFRAVLAAVLVPVSSIGAIPIVLALCRGGVRAGPLVGFVVAVGAINPLSLAYGLSQVGPSVMIAIMLGVVLTAVACGGVVQAIFTRSTDETTTKLSASDSRGFLRRASAMLVGPAGLHVLIALVTAGVSAALVERGSVGERLFEPSWTNLPMVALVTTAAPITPETGMMQASQIYLLGTAPGAILLWLVFGPGLNAGLFTLLLRERGLKFALVSTAVTLVITLMPAFAVDAALFDSTKVAVEDSHAFDETGRPFHMGENDKRGPRATAGRLLLRESGTTQGVSLVALAAVALVRVLPAGARVDRSVPSRWNRPLPRSVLPVLLIGGCVAFVVTGFYAFYPAPAQTLRDMKRIDAELGVAVRTGRIDEARPCIAQLRTLALRAVTGDTLRLWRGGSDLREGMIEYEKRLAELDGLLDRDDAPARVDGMIEASKQLGLVVGALNRR